MNITENLIARTAGCREARLDRALSGPEVEEILDRVTRIKEPITHIWVHRDTIQVETEYTTVGGDTRTWTDAYWLKGKIE